MLVIILLNRFIVYLYSMRVHIIVLSTLILVAWPVFGYSEPNNQADNTVFGQILSKPVGTIKSTTYPASKIGYEPVEFASNNISILPSSPNSIVSKIAQKTWLWVLVVISTTNLMYFGYLAKRKFLTHRA